MSAEASPVKIRKRLKRWQLVLIVNVSGLLGIFITLFTLPGNTPFWLWVGASIFALAVMNVIVLFRFRSAGQDAEPTDSRKSTFVVAVG